NGFILLGAERLRRRAAVRELARREGTKDDGGRVLDTLEYPEAGMIGLAQSAALIAGISRDGMCMASGLARGLDNADAGRFGFLLATPIILAAGVLKVGDLTGPNGAGIRAAAVLAAIVAAVFAVATVHFLTRYFRRGNLRPFGVYCLIFGAAMIIYNA
ncbi:MAG: undecaprenyl-diphosphate phosphatase, partial [Solirubrobacteraceae bacterium]